MFQIVIERNIAAGRGQVWHVITDFERYPEWNPFITSCKSSLEVGSPIAMKVRLLPGLILPQRETVRVNVKDERLEYGIRLPLGLLRSARTHELTAIDAGGTRYRSGFTLQGPLAPLVKLLLAKPLRKGFQGMTDGVVAEAQHRESGRTPSETKSGLAL